MKVFRVVTWCIYAVLFFVLYLAAVRDSANLGYPTALVALGGICAALSFFGVVAYAFDVQSIRVKQWARIVFPIFAIEVVVGVLMDAVLPGDYNLKTAGLVWLSNAAFVLFLFSPAFYANYQLAYGHKNRPQTVD